MANRDKQAVTKAHLIQVLSSRHGLGRQDSRKLVNDVISVIVESIQQGKTVKIAHLGTWTSTPRPERVAKDPRTGEALVMPADRRLKHAISHTLKEAVRQSGQ